MGYQYDIFISYKRDPETYRWIKNHFEPLLTLRVGLELGRKVDIFIDDQLEAGTTWPIDLGLKLGCSRIIVPLFTRTYFNSKWCACELSLMLSRERSLGYRIGINSQGLIVPATIHDGDTFPNQISHIQRFGIQQCFNVRMADDSPRAAELDDILAHNAPAFANAINQAPPWQSTWSDQAAKEFYDLLFQRDEPEQESVPRLTNA
jgi:hypothetical protein